MADGNRDVSDRKPLALWHIVLPELALAILIALRPRLSPWACVALSTALMAATLHTMLTVTTGSGAGSDYGVGCSLLAVVIFCTPLFMGLTDPMHDFRHVRDTDPRPLADRSFHTRLWNSLCLLRNYRLIGWNVQVPNVPPPFKGSRAQHLLRCLRQMAWCFLLADLTESFAYINHDLYPRLGGSEPPVNMSESARTIGIMAYEVMTYAHVNFFYLPVATLAVTLGIGHHEDWRDMFGNWTDAYTVRRFWGRVWHQVLRRFFSHYGDFALRVLHISRGTVASSQVQVHVAFFLSGLLHSLGDLMINQRAFGRSFPFFFANACAITAEDVVLGIARRMGIAGPTRATKLLGYVWVAIWFRFSIPLYMDWMYQSGVTVLPFLSHFSPTRSLLVPLIHQIWGPSS